MNEGKISGDALTIPENAVAANDDTMKRGRAAMLRAKRREQRLAEQERQKRQAVERQQLAAVALDAARAQDDARIARSERVRFYDEVRSAVEQELRKRIETGSLGNLSVRELVKVLSVVHDQQRRDTVKGPDVLGSLPTIVLSAIPRSDGDYFERFRRDTLADVYALADRVVEADE